MMTEFTPLLAALSGGAITAIIIGAVVLILIICIVVMYNRLVRLRQSCKESWSDIDTELQRRHDLIPNLIETVKGYMAHERETLEAVIQARNQAMGSLKTASMNPGDASAMAGLAGAEGMLGGALGKLFALSESYPDLKANQNMANLQEELTATENKVAFSRQAFNDAVTGYNTYKQTFPPVFFAGMFGHGQDATLLEFESKKISEAPKVQF